MNYKVLYRKYRPSTFDEVVGQDNTITLLKDSVLNDKISHAYIFSGPRGTGKTSCAKIFAKAINCLNPDKGNPCGQCVNCLNFATSNDIYEIDAASNNGVDQVREIIENIKLTPINLKYKVYIIDEVHMLSISAFNALLLTLEEPPKHAVFILATTDIEDVPITVLSRCQRLDFKKITDADIEKNLNNICNQEKIEIDSDALSEISSFADGGMRDALSILDQLSKTNEKITQDVVLNSIGVISNKKIKELIIAYSNDDISFIENFINDLRKNAIDFKSLIKKMIKELRNSALEMLDNQNIQMFEKYKKLSFDLAALLYKNNVNVDVLTLFEFTLLPIEIGDKVSDTIVTKTINNNEHLTPANADKNAEKLETSENKLTPANQEKNDHDGKIEHMQLIDIRVNNCFVKASKNYLIDIKKNWQEYIDKLTKKKLKGLLLDLEVVLASDDYAVLMSNFDNTVIEVNNGLKTIEDSFKKITNLDYRFIAISKELWDIKTDEYKTNLKNNVKYNIIEESESIIDNSLLDDVFDDIEIEVQ